MTEPNQVGESASPTPNLDKLKHPILKSILWITVILFLSIFALYVYAVVTEKQLPATEVLTAISNGFIRILELLTS